MSVECEGFGGSAGMIAATDLGFDNLFTNGGADPAEGWFGGYEDVGVDNAWFVDRWQAMFSLGVFGEIEYL